MHSDVELVIRIQALDQRIAELENEVAALPKHIAEIEKALDSHLRRLEADKAALAANHKERRQAEGDIESHQQKISRLRDQMSQAKTNEQYRAFQKEIDYLENAIRTAEDKILDLMTASEPLEAAVKQAEAALKEEQKQVEGEKKIAREKTAEDEAELTKYGAERAELLQQLPAAMTATYEKIRKKRRGIVVAEVVDGRCMACQIMLRPQVYQDLRKGDEIMYCESCGRILLHNPPQSFVDMTA